MLQPGLIMDRPLLISAVIEHAAAQFGDVEIVSRETHGPLFRYTYAHCAARARQLAHALQGLGLRAGDAVATLAWNNHRHLEAYYAVSGSGLVIHTCNPRLHRASPRQVRLAAVRRTQRRGSLLYLGHYRESQRRAVFAPRHRSQCHRLLPAGSAVDIVPGR